jgi:hypothetical protein
MDVSPFPIASGYDDGVRAAVLGRASRRHLR